MDLDEEEELKLALQMSLEQNFENKATSNSSTTNFSQFWQNLPDKLGFKTSFSLIFRILIFFLSILVLQILSWLPIRDIFVLRSVCKRLFLFIGENVVWEQLYLSQWKVAPKGEGIGPTATPSFSSDPMSQLAAYRMKHQKIFHQTKVFQQLYLKSGIRGFVQVFKNWNLPVFVESRQTDDPVLSIFPIYHEVFVFPPFYHDLKVLWEYLAIICGWICKWKN